MASLLDFDAQVFVPVGRSTNEAIAMKHVRDIDIIELTAGRLEPSQAEVVLRAMSYSTGELWDPKGTPALGCAWLFTYPYQSGKVNYAVTGLAFGMKSKEVFPEGLILISIPYNWIPIITQNLQEMNWAPPAYSDGREKFKKREKEMLQELAQKSQNP